MRLESVRDLKKEAIEMVAHKLAKPYGSSFRANERFRFPPVFGIQPTGKGNYKLSVHIRDKSYYPLIEPLERRAVQELDIRITGNIFPLCDCSNPNQGSPLSIGLSISHYHPLAGAGSLGCFVRKRGQSDLFILSNNHVLANYNNASVGDSIIHPARQNGGQDTDRVASLSEFVPLTTNNEINIVDAAIAEVKTEDIGNIGQIPGIGALQECCIDASEMEEGENEYIVAKFGSRTNLTRGRIQSLELESFTMDYNDVLTNCRFQLVMAFEGLDAQPFSGCGDSGSVIVKQNEQDSFAIALLFAGSQTGGSNGLGLTYAIPIKTVLDYLNLEIAVN